MPKDTKLYDLLNVSPTAAENDIRKAYYKLAKIHHPDKLENKDEAAEEKFKEIKFAYEVLTDKNKRETYDRYGLEGLKDGVGGTEFEDIFSHLFGGFGGMGGGMGGGFPFSPFDIFGGGMGGGRGGRGAKRRTQNMVYPLKVTLEELYQGATKNIELERSVLCSGCDGAGGKPGATKNCTACHGRGFTMQYKQIGPGMVQQMQAMCRECNGQGETLNEKDKCKTCQGKKTKKEKKKFEVNVDRGMHDSQKITFRGESNQEPGGVESGDLIVVLQQTEHEIFTRNHDDLFMSHTINITEALCGFKLVVKHLDGRSLVVNQPAGEFISPGTIRAIPSEGMPIHKNPYEKGNLYIKFDVKFPEANSLNEAQITKLESLLPTRTKVEIPTGDHVDEVSMVDFDSTKGSSKSSSHAGASRGHPFAMNDDDDDDEDGPAGQRVECNTH